jgi:hypothetical protein
LALALLTLVAGRALAGLVGAIFRLTPAEADDLRNIFIAFARPAGSRLRMCSLSLRGRVSHWGRIGPPLCALGKGRREHSAPVAFPGQRVLDEIGRRDEAEAEIILVAGLPGENEVDMVLQVLADARRLVKYRDPEGTKSSGLPTAEGCKSCGAPAGAMSANIEHRVDRGGAAQRLAARLKAPPPFSSG